MAKGTTKTIRVFKTAWFAKASRKLGINDHELCDAIGQVINGQVDDLGGGVLKKRVNKNMHRAIILAKSKRHCTYVYIIAKNDRKNIEHGELDAFRKLAKSYEALTDAQIVQLVKNGDMTEICHDD